MAPTTASRGGGSGSVPSSTETTIGDAGWQERLTALLGAPVEVLPEIGSTNQELTRRAKDAALHHRPLPDLTVLATDYQSAGRGRLDRSWVVEPGEALTFSVLLRPGAGGGSMPLPTQTYGWLTMVMAAAVVETMRERGVDARIKWPNDVLVAGRKLVGILATLVSFDALPPAVVVGVGVNVSTSQLPEQTATSVRLEGSAATREELLEAIMTKFLGLYRRFCRDPEDLARADGGLRADLERHLVTLGAQVRVELPGDQGFLTGQVVGLDSHGALQVRDDDGALHTLSAGDVVHLRLAQGGR